MTFRYRGFRVLVTEGSTDQRVAFLFDPMVPGAPCLCIDGKPGEGATGLSDRCHGYIDERYGIDADEVLVMSKAKDATP